MKTTRISMALAAGLALQAGGAARAQTYHVQDLGATSTIGDVESFDVTGVGPVVVGFATAMSHHHTAFVRSGGVVTVIPPIGTDTESVAFGADGLGRVVGVSYRLGDPTVRAFRWQGGTTTALGNFTPRGTNAAGDIVGFVATTDADGLRVEHACVLPAGAAGPTDLGTLFGSSASAAYAINSRGQAVGQSNGPGDQGFRAALWWQGVRVDLGTLGGDASGAYAINEAGSVAVGWSDTGGTNPTNRAAKFVLGGAGAVVSRVNMGTLPTTVPGAGAWSYAYGVNNSGWVVGQSNGRAFLDLGAGLLEINGMLPQAQGWFVVAARSIDESGRIAAWGLDSVGTPKALLLVPCDADFNRDGSLSVQDIFDFLNEWFADSPRSDFNRVGGTNVQDVFDFLASWFAGCQA